MLERVLRRLGSPNDWRYHGYAMVAPQVLWGRYKKLAQAAGFKQLYLVLSFDCDTEEDIAVVWDMHSRLVDMGVHPAYAVPGELLQRGEKTYRKVLEAGGEFINHGYREHTYFDERHGRHASCFFYDQQADEIIREDVVRGDENLRKVLGADVRGFRVPHFGTYQKPFQLRFLHRILKELDYDFSTSTMPVQGFRFGPVFDRFGIREIPVSGMNSQPLRILDSWTCFRAPKRKFTPADYSREGENVARCMEDLGAGLLNYYVDPCHIHDNPEFFSTVAAWVKVAESVNYTELLENI